MAAKGTAGKSASGASMSKYDMEVEERLQALEAVVHEHSKTTSTSYFDIEAPLADLPAVPVLLYGIFINKLCFIYHERNKARQQDLTTLCTQNLQLQFSFA